MSQLTSRVSDLQCRVGGSGAGGCLGSWGVGGITGLGSACTRGPGGYCQQCWTLLAVAGGLGGPGESRSCVLANEPWDSLDGDDSDSMCLQYVESHLKQMTS